MSLYVGIRHTETCVALQGVKVKRTCDAVILIIHQTLILGERRHDTLLIAPTVNTHGVSRVCVREHFPPCLPCFAPLTLSPGVAPLWDILPLSQRRTCFWEIHPSFIATTPGWPFLTVPSASLGCASSGPSAPLPYLQGPLAAVYFCFAVS